MERLRALFPQLSELRTAVSADSVDDEPIRERIRRGFERTGRSGARILPPLPRCSARLRTRGLIRDGRWIVVATAHPAKFAEIVEPLIGRPVAVPESLAALLARPTQCIQIEPQLSALRNALRGRV